MESRSKKTLRCSSVTVFCPNHWKGVNGLGTNPPSDTVTDGFLVWGLPSSTQLRASSPMARVSSSVSVGSPVRK